MIPLDARLLAALRAEPLHLPASELAGKADASVEEIRRRLAELQRAGFEIEEHPALGFRFISAPDRLIADDIAARLGKCPLVREIVVFEETASTNDLALQRGRESAASGLAIVAERQTAGRGRFGRRWESAAHRGLWFSLLLRPDFPIAHWPRLTTWAAVALAFAIERTVVRRTEIKWPNDVFLGGRKVAGILIESGAHAGNAFAVVGVGVNVNQEADDFPPELAGRAGSLRMATGRAHDRAEFAALLLGEMSARYAQLACNFAEIVSAASERSFLLGQWVQLRAGTDLIEGMAEAFDENGHLLLRDGEGRLQRQTAGEVTVVGHRVVG